MVGSAVQIKDGSRQRMVHSREGPMLMAMRACGAIKSPLEAERRDCRLV